MVIHFTNVRILDGKNPSFAKLATMAQLTTKISVRIMLNMTATFARANGKKSTMVYVWTAKCVNLN
jgi:hypothetical protein